MLLLKDKNVRDLSFLNTFWGTEFSVGEKEKLAKFLEAHKLKSTGLSNRKISEKINISRSTLDKWIYAESIPYIAHYLRYYHKNKTKNKILSLNSTRGGILIGPWIKVPAKISRYQDIVKVIKQINKEETPIQELAYILGVMVGDASKHGIKRKNRIARRIQLRLTTRHDSNERFGEYVADCLRKLKVKTNRTKNCPAGKRNTHDFYAWHSQCSMFIDWMFKVCLGLDNDKLTSYDKININWILNTPRAFRISFLQGVADSDGYIDITEYRAGIVTKVKAYIFKEILKSLGVKSKVGFLHKKTLQQVKTRLEEAVRLPLFNPEVNSYRYQLMKKVTKAKKLKHHWPRWFGNEIDKYLKEGLSSTKIIKRVLKRHNTIIRQGGIYKRSQKLKCQIKT